MTGLRSVTKKPETSPSSRWRATDFALFLLLPLASMEVSGYPVPELAMLAAVALATVRPVQASVPGWLPGLLGALIVWMLATAMLNDLLPYRRLLHLLLFCAIALFMAQGRFSMRAVSRGLASGLVIAAGVGLVGLGADGYEGRLTGLFGDPNLAGFYLTALGAVAAAHIANTKQRWLLLAVLVVFVGLTLSRTSILAMALLGVWILASRRWSPAAGIALIATLVYAIGRFIDYLRLVGPFAERAGSDALRDRIVELEKARITQNPWIGNGPGTSTVQVDGQTFFFHNSYLALQNEGGWAAVVIFLALGLAVLISLSRLAPESRNPWLEGSVVAVATSAANLGEVLLELPTAVVIGAAVWHMSRARAGGSGTFEGGALTR